MLDFPPCPQCGASFSACDHDAARGVLTCHACGASFDVEIEEGAESPAEAQPSPDAPPESPVTPTPPRPSVPEPPAPSAPPSPPATTGSDTSPKPAPRPDPEGFGAWSVPAGAPRSGGRRRAVPVDEGLSVSRSPGRVEVSYRAGWAKTIFLLVFAVFWNGFMVVWFGISLSQGLWEMALFGTLHGLIGLVVAYSALVGLLNTTTVSVRDGRLRVWSAPLPTPGRQDLAADEIGQLFVRSRVVRSKNSVRTVYDLIAETTHGTEVRVVKGLAAPERARVLEAEVERALGVEDRAVPGEFLL